MFDLNAFVSKINLFRQVNQRRFVGQVLERTAWNRKWRERGPMRWKFYVTFNTAFWPLRIITLLPLFITKQFWNIANSEQDLRFPRKHIFSIFVTLCLETRSSARSLQVFDWPTSLRNAPIVPAMRFKIITTDFLQY